MEILNQLIGNDSAPLTSWQMAFRAFALFFISLVLIRIAGIRTLGKQSAFDTLTLLMMGSVLGRTIVFNQSFWGSVLATFVLMILHRFLAYVTFKSPLIGKLVKGKSKVLLQNGKGNQEIMLKELITEADIMEALRRDVHKMDIEQIKEARMERSGHISIIVK